MRRCFDNGSKVGKVAGPCVQVITLNAECVISPGDNSRNDVADTYETGIMHKHGVPGDGSGKDGGDGGGDGRGHAGPGGPRGRCRGDIASAGHSLDAFSPLFIIHELWGGVISHTLAGRPWLSDGS